MSLKIIGNVADEVHTAIERVVRPHLQTESKESQLLVYDGASMIDAEEVRRTLDRGGVIAIIGASAGQLADLAPGTGCDVTQDAALFALKRTPIAGHPGKFHTIVTMLAHPGAIRMDGAVADAEGNQRSETQGQAPASAESIAEELKHHLLIDVPLDSTLIPPFGAFYNVNSYRIPWNPSVTQSFWPTANGATQTGSALTTITAYVYFANGVGQAPHYVVLLVHNGSVIPATGGSGGLCSYFIGERAFALAANTLSTIDDFGGLSLVSQSPAAGTSTPVVDTINYPMTVMAQGDGGMVSQAFTVSASNSTDNPDWGVTQAGNPAANEASWMYYNQIGWDASTQTVSNFPDWWAQMYDSDDHVVELDAPCINSVSFDAMALWTIPQNPNNSGPLNIWPYFTQTLRFDGFVNRGNSGEWNHQIGEWNPSINWSLGNWDLVAMTQSTPDAPL